jgi:hypothetical protein
MAEALTVSIMSIMNGNLATISKDNQHGSNVDVTCHLSVNIHNLAYRPQLAPLCRSFPRSSCLLDTQLLSPIYMINAGSASHGQRNTHTCQNLNLTINLSIRIYNMSGICSVPCPVPTRSYPINKSPRQSHRNISRGGQIRRAQPIKRPSPRHCSITCFVFQRHTTQAALSLPYFSYPITHYALRIRPTYDSWFASARVIP